jgi:hypothetical protein
MLYLSMKRTGSRYYKFMFVFNVKNTNSCSFFTGMASMIYIQYLMGDAYTKGFRKKIKASRLSALYFAVNRNHVQNTLPPFPFF